MNNLKKLAVKSKEHFGLENFSAASVDEMLETRGGGIMGATPMDWTPGDSVGGGGGNFGGVGAGITRSFNSWSNNSFFNGVSSAVSWAGEVAAIAGGIVVDKIIRLNGPIFIDTPEMRNYIKGGNNIPNMPNEKM